MSDRDMVDQVYGSGMPGRAALAVLAFVGVVGIALGFTQLPKKANAEFCAAPIAEQLDTRSSQHLLPQADAKYSSPAPTSGPHRIGTHPTGVLTTKIPAPVQVALIEAGGVLVQYNSDASEQSKRDLKAFARAHPGVTTGPNRVDAPIVVTAWQYRMRCNGYDENALRKFIEAHLQEDHAH